MCVHMCVYVCWCVGQVTSPPVFKDESVDLALPREQALDPEDKH